MGRRAFAEADQFGRAIPRIEPSQCSVALSGEPDRAVGSGRDVVYPHAGVDRIIFDPERAFLGAGVAQEGGRGEDSNGGSKKLAAIHCVTPFYQCEGLDADIDLEAVYPDPAPSSGK